MTCLLQLGLAYRGAGKHVAALKALLRVTELEPTNWHAKFLIGDIQRQMGLFEASLKTFTDLKSDKELAEADEQESLPLKIAIPETQLSMAGSEVRNGFVGRAKATLVDCLVASMEIVNAGRGARMAWKIIGDALVKLGELMHKDDDHVGSLRDLLAEIFDKLSSQDIDSKNPLLTLVTTALLKDRISSSAASSVCIALGALSYSLRMLLEAHHDDDALGPSWFDIGYALYRLRSKYSELGIEGKTERDVTMQSIQCLRSALQKEPLNGTFWNLLGVLAGKTSPKLAQHSLIRACELNVRVSGLQLRPWS